MRGQTLSYYVIYKHVNSIIMGCIASHEELTPWRAISMQRCNMHIHIHDLHEYSTVFQSTKSHLVQREKKVRYVLYFFWFIMYTYVLACMLICVYMFTHAHTTFTVERGRRHWEGMGRRYHALFWGARPPLANLAPTPYQYFISFVHAIQTSWPMLWETAGDLEGDLARCMWRSGRHLVPIDMK